MTQLTKGGDTHELSTDINVITAEINAYQRVAGEAIFEIGKRLKHVKENDLVHGEFGKWLESVEIDRTLATRLMKVADEFDGKYATWHKLPLRSLYEIATMPEEARTETHTIPSTGAEKTVDEMTVRELREVKKALKEAEKAKELAEQQAKVAQRSEELLQRRVEEIENEIPEVETRIEYVTPVDYLTIKAENERYRQQYGASNLRTVGAEEREEFYDEFATDLEMLRKKYGSIVFDVKEIREYGASNVEYAEKVNAFSDFWNSYVKAVMGKEIIIDAEVV